MRDEFISIASHELKTPLTSLKLQAQLNRRMIDTANPESYSKKRVDKLVESTEKQVDRLARLVEDMLDISRIATGKLAMQLEAVDLGELSLEVIDRLRSQVESVGSTLELDIEPGLIGNWDRYRIEQVISNLLMNAVRYSPGTPLYVGVKKIGNMAQLKVRDEGPGIAPENQERIFQRFERAVNMSSLTGLGLGLYICREILDSHRGTIAVESVVGQGATFTVKLPLA